MVQHNTQTESSHACTFLYHNFEICACNRTELWLTVCALFRNILMGNSEEQTRRWQKQMAVRCPYAKTVPWDILVMAKGSENNLSVCMDKAKCHSSGIQSHLTYLLRTFMHICKIEKKWLWASSCPANHLAVCLHGTTQPQLDKF